METETPTCSRRQSNAKKIVWYENDGNQGFTVHTIVSSLQLPIVCAVDMDSDGDLDVVSATAFGAVLWHENDGSQNFTLHVLPTTSNNTTSIFAADVDGDGDTDVLSSSSDNRPLPGTTTTAIKTSHVRIITVGGPFCSKRICGGHGWRRRHRCLSASYSDDKIAWYENDGSQNFTTMLSLPQRIRLASYYAADVDGDGDLDVLSGSDGIAPIAWYENLNFVVVNTNDSGPGSLRQAIQQANASPGVDTITFAIGVGYQTIAPTSALPTITDPMIIDGTTQPGYAGAPLIEVWGFAAGPDVHGLVITADNSTVKDLVINLFDGNGILITGNNNRIEHSYIGTDVSGTIAVPNALNGVEIIGGSNNIIGGTGPGTANIIAFNGGQGVLVDTGAGNAIRRNSIHSNEGFGIALINGGNNNQAAPTVTRWTSVGGTTKVWISLTSTPSTTFSIDVVRNAACDPSGFGEGQVFLGTAMLTTDAGGTGSVIAVFGVGTPLNQFVTATATSPANDTSDFSNCRAFRLQAPFTADSVPPLPPPPLPPIPAPETGKGQRRFPPGLCGSRLSTRSDNDTTPQTLFVQPGFASAQLPMISEPSRIRQRGPTYPKVRSLVNPGEWDAAQALEHALPSTC